MTDWHGPTCTVDGCDGPHEAKGLCARHYNQARRGATDRPRATHRTRVTPRRYV